MKNIIQLKNSVEIRELKELWLKEQNNTCPILKQEFENESFVIDHLHCSAKEDPDEETGKGFCRGAIHNCANVVEGKILKDFIRYGLLKYISVPDFLRNLADYLESNKFHSENDIYIHSTEKPLKPRLSKNSYNKLVKEIHKNNTKTKIPPFVDKRGNFNKQLEKLFNKYNIVPEFSKS